MKARFYGGLSVSAWSEATEAELDEKDLKSDFWCSLSTTRSPQQEHISTKEMSLFVWIIYCFSATCSMFSWDAVPLQRLCHNYPHFWTLFGIKGIWQQFVYSYSPACCVARHNLSWKITDSFQSIAHTDKGLWKTETKLFFSYRGKQYPTDAFILL